MKKLLLLFLCLSTVVLHGVPTPSVLFLGFRSGTYDQVSLQWYRDAVMKKLIREGINVTSPMEVESVMQQFNLDAVSMLDVSMLQPICQQYGIRTISYGVLLREKETTLGELKVYRCNAPAIKINRFSISPSTGRELEKKLAEKISFIINASLNGR